jgi:abequosyltransferase
MIIELTDSKMNKPRLSICIPTRNRSVYIEKTLASIVCQERFLKECELVVADNCSNDSTREVLEKYSEKYENIKYERRDKNYGVEDNVIKVVTMASGEYIQFLSDKACLRKGALEVILNIIDTYDPSLLMLLNGNISRIDSSIKRCESLNEFVSMTSYWSTWMPGVVLKRKKLNEIKDLRRLAGTYLILTDWLFQIIEASSIVIISNHFVVEEQEVGPKGGYNLFKVFVQNYLEFYRPYIESGVILKKTFKREKRKLLIRFIFPWYIKTVIWKKHSFEISGATSIIFQNYWSSPWLYTFPLFFIKYLLSTLIGKISNKYRLELFGSI